MEHQEDNARFENYLENRLAESLQISGVAGENQHQANLAASELPASADIASSKSDQRDEDDEWKYIHEVQQSEKLQQQKHQTLDAGNGYSSHPEDMIVGIGNGASAGFVYEEEDVEVIKNDGDFSTNSNTTTSTGEVAPKGEHTFEETEAAPEQQHQKPQSPDLGQEEEDEQSSVATTYGTSSLSENNPTPLDEVVPVAPLEAQNLDSFDGKENVEPIVEQEDNYSQLNPNAVIFVPSFGSQPASPLPAADVPVFGLNHRQILGGPLDDLVAESPRKGSAKDNMDAIAVPDEREFDIEADKRPHELEQDSDVFGEGNLEEQLLNGVGSANPPEPTNVIDHGPETSVDLDLSLDQVTGDGDIMKHSIYGEQNTSIEDILNSVQPLPTQPGDELVEKESLNIEVKELVSKSPSTEELQFQEEINHGFDLQQPLYQKPLGGSADEDPMQASFYLENTSSEAQNQEIELPVERRDPFAEESFLLDTSAPQLTPQTNEPMANFELNSQLADIVDITPSPLSLTEEKHLVEDTKEMVGDDLQTRPEEPEHLELGFVPEDELELEQPTEIVAGVDLEQGFAKEDDPEPKVYLESNVVEPVSAGAPPQEESYAAPNAASGNIAQHEDALSPAAQGINPFAQPFTPAYAHLAHKELDEIAPQEESNIVEESQPLNAEAPTYDELQLEEELVEEEYAVNPSLAPTNLDLGEKIVSESLENKVELPTAIATTDAEPPLVGLDQEKLFDGEDLQGLDPVKPEPIALEEKLPTEAEVVLPPSEPGTETNKIEEVVKADISTPLAETIIKAKAISVDSKKPTTKTVAKPKTSASLPTAKRDTAAVPPSGATKVATARPRTAPVAAKTTIGVTKPLSAGLTTATRKPLSSSAGPNAKGLPKTALTSTRPSTAPISKPNVAAKTTVNKQGANASTTGGSVSAPGARAPARTRPLTSAPKSATNATSAEDGTNSLTRKVASANAAGSKPRVMVVPPATAKPKVSPPRSATSALRKATPSNGTLLSARSPTKPTSNGTGKTSTTTITTSTTITKTFTARPAPKSTHSTSSTTTSQGSSLRRPLGAATASAPRKLSPLKPTTATTRASPLKSSTTPLKSKAKESIPTKPSPADQKIRKSTSLKGATSKKAEEVPPLSDATTVATNGGTKEEVTVEQNGSGPHQVDGSHQIVEQQDQQVLPVETTVQASLLEF
ncbi:205 kDa microtubule-associated protein [Drosophila bipectinata]|uniref:205 kDa microtubule-associated protein n=1 Tax=Drosophila bipectinata TaxID=42026 RepID=UPI0038B389BC